MKRRDLSKVLLGSATGAILAGKASTAQACTATQIYDARAFGACGDGVTDDAPALQAWLNAIPGGGSGFLPAAPVAYKVGSMLTRSGFVTIRGEGLASKIVYTGPAASAVLRLEAGRFSWLSNFYIVGNPIVSAGIRLLGCQEGVELNQVFVDGITKPGGAALWISDSWDIAILGGAFRQSKCGIRMDDAGFNSGSNVVNVVTAVGVNCSGNDVGIDYKSGAVLNVFGCDFSDAGTVAVEIGADIGGSRFVGTANIIGNWFEASGAGVWVGRANTSTSPPKDVEVRGNYFGNSGEQIHLYRSDRARLCENQWGPGAIIIDAGVTRTRVEARGVTITDNAAAGQTGYLQYDQIVVGDVIARGTFRVGSGASVSRLLTGTTSVDFPLVAHGAQVSATVTVTGAVLGDLVVGVSHSVAVPAGVLLMGDVTAPNIVTVKLLNFSGAAVNLAPGTVRALVTRVI
jgi:hypothetical protein